MALGGPLTALHWSPKVGVCANFWITVGYSRWLLTEIEGTAPSTFTPCTLKLQSPETVEVSSCLDFIGGEYHPRFTQRNLTSEALNAISCISSNPALPTTWAHQVGWRATVVFPNLGEIFIEWMGLNATSNFFVSTKLIPGSQELRLGNTSQAT